MSAFCEVLGSEHVQLAPFVAHEHGFVEECQVVSKGAGGVGTVRGGGRDDAGAEGEEAGGKYEWCSILHVEKGPTEKRRMLVT